MDLHKYSEAKDVWERAAALAKDGGNDSFKAILADNVAQVYHKFGQTCPVWRLR